MKITKSILNYARRRNLDIVVYDDILEDDVLMVCFYELDNDCEWMFSYRVNENGSLSFNGNIYLQESIKEELPAYISDAKKLKEMINFVSVELAKLA